MDWTNRCTFEWGFVTLTYTHTHGEKSAGQWPRRLLINSVRLQKIVYHSLCQTLDGENSRESINGFEQFTWSDFYVVRRNNCGGLVVGYIDACVWIIKIVFMHYSFMCSPRKPFPSACSLAHALHSEAIGITVKSSGNFQGTISCLLCVFFFHCPFVFPSSHCLLDITLYAHTHTCTARTFFGVPVEIGVFDVCSGSRFPFFFSAVLLDR